MRHCRLPRCSIKSIIDRAVTSSKCVCDLPSEGTIPEFIQTCYRSMLPLTEYSVKLILLTGADVIVTSSQLISLYFISSRVRTNTLYQVVCLQLMIFSTLRHILLSPLPVATGVLPVLFCLVTELPLVKLFYAPFFASWWESLLRCVYGSHAHFITPCHRNFLMYFYDL